MSSSRPFVPSPPPSSHPKRSITLPLPRTVQPPLSPSSPPSSPHTLVPRLRVDSITHRALHPTHVEHHLLKKQRRDRERNESLNRHYNTVIAEVRRGCVKKRGEQNAGESKVASSSRTALARQARSSANPRHRVYILLCKCKTPLTSNRFLAYYHECSAS